MSVGAKSAPSLTVRSGYCPVSDSFILSANCFSLLLLFHSWRRSLFRLREMLATKLQKLLMDWRFIATNETHDTELPVDLRALDPPAHQASAPHFFMD